MIIMIIMTITKVALTLIFIKVFYGDDNGDTEAGYHNHDYDLFHPVIMTMIDILIMIMMIIKIMTMMMIITSILLYWCTGFLISLSADDPRLLLVCRAGGTASTFYREELSFILKDTENLKFCSPAG